jgi:hypothetical protein
VAPVGLFGGLAIHGGRGEPALELPLDAIDVIG